LGNHFSSKLRSSRPQVVTKSIARGTQYKRLNLPKAPSRSLSARAKKQGKRESTKNQRARFAKERQEARAARKGPRNGKWPLGEKGGPPNPGQSPRNVLRGGGENWKHPPVPRSVESAKINEGS